MPQILTLLDLYGIFICTMKTNLFNMSQLSFPLSSTPGLTFYEQLGGCFQKSREGCLPYGAPVPCFQFLVESELLIYFCYFVCIILCYFMFFVVCVCFPCVDFVPGLHYFDFRQIFFLLITPQLMHEQLVLCYRNKRDILNHKYRY